MKARLYRKGESTVPAPRDLSFWRRETEGVHHRGMSFVEYRTLLFQQSARRWEWSVWVDGDLIASGTRVLLASADRAMDRALRAELRGGSR